MASEYTRKEKSLLRQLASEAWEAELTRELDELFERFCIWADDGISAFDLAEEIHEFHNGAARELYKCYAGLPPESAVARAIAMGMHDEQSIDPALLEKLQPSIEAFRGLERE